MPRRCPARVGPKIGRNRPSPSRRGSWRVPSVRSASQRADRACHDLDTACAAPSISTRWPTSLRRRFASGPWRGPDGPISRQGIEKRRRADDSAPTGVGLGRAQRADPRGDDRGQQRRRGEPSGLLLRIRARPGEAENPKRFSCRLTEKGSRDSLRARPERRPALIPGKQSPLGAARRDVMHGLAGTQSR